MKGELYPARSCMHRQMGPMDSCDTCAGRGYYSREIANPDGPTFLWSKEVADYYDSEEVYCDCPCGIERRKVER